VPPLRPSTSMPALSSPGEPGGLEAQLQNFASHEDTPPQAPVVAPARPAVGPARPIQTPAPMPQVRSPVSRTLAPVAVPPVAPPALTGQRPLGPASALAPSDLMDHARAAEGAFASGDYADCIKACVDAARRGLAFAGEGSLGAQAYLLHVDGADLLKLQALAARSTPRVDDAAFALYMLMHIFTRLHAAGLPTPTTE